jgi:uncharacterized protein YegP (UPF0339 family)
VNNVPKRINNKWVFSDSEIDEQIARGKELYKRAEKSPSAVKFTYDPVKRVVTILTKDKSGIVFPVSRIRELRNASTEQIQKGYITEGGEAIHWDELDAHYTIAGLAANIFGTAAWMRELGKRGGSKTSTAKKHAARLNGQKGGRPAVQKEKMECSVSSRDRATTGAVFRLQSDKSGKFRLSVTAANGRVILTSRLFTSRDAAIRSAESLRKAAQNTRLERKKAEDGSLYFVLKSKTGLNLAQSERYSNSKTLERAFESVKAATGWTKRR